MKYVYYIAIVTALFIPQFVANAQDLPGLVWSDRVSKETADGDIKETAPYVEIGTIRLSRFSQMQSLTLQDTMTVGSDDEVETLFVFRAWQGGASQGEQLILVTASPNGVDVIGPFAQDFETVTITPATADFGPIFELYGADVDKPIARLEYFDGQLIEIN
ncbi:hypothetical protein [Lentilitoribacter sp. EG35]|uniref:hypothetical protein n=1 Tax=Lentilitoribacter sp. EG35 TaxID=3234192 RepID=UPI00345FB2F8